MNVQLETFTVFGVRISVQPLLLYLKFLMAEASGRIDLEELMANSKILVEFLSEEKDLAKLKHFLRQSNTLLTQCENHFNETRNSIAEYEKEIDACKKKADESLSDSGEELQRLRKELEEEQRSERRLREDLRDIIVEIDELEKQMECVEEERKSVKKMERDEQRLEKKLSLYASIANVIPDLEDESSRISGHIVDRERKEVKKFELDSSNLSDTRDQLWEMINSSAGF